MNVVDPECYPSLYTALNSVFDPELKRRASDELDALIVDRENASRSTAKLEAKVVVTTLLVKLNSLVGDVEVLCEELGIYAREVDEG